MVEDYGVWLCQGHSGILVSQGDVSDVILKSFLLSGCQGELYPELPCHCVHASEGTCSQWI